MAFPLDADWSAASHGVPLVSFQARSPGHRGLHRGLGKGIVEAEVYELPGHDAVNTPGTMPSNDYSTKLVDNDIALMSNPFWYQMPLTNWNESIPELREQTPVTVLPHHPRLHDQRRSTRRMSELGRYNAVALTNGCGVKTGVIFAASNNEADALDQSTSGSKPELVALAKGSTVSHLEKIGCYFVLRIAWREGIMYQKARLT